MRELRFVACRNVIVVALLRAGIDHGVVRIVCKTQIVRTLFICLFLGFGLFFHNGSLCKRPIFIHHRMLPRLGR